MEYCPSCNIEYPVGTRYCKRCKTILSFLAARPDTVKYLQCSHCNNITSIDTGICQHCHQALPPSVQANTTHPPDSIPKSMKKKKKKQSFDQKREIDATQIPIETTECPKCGKNVLKDFESCPHCGTPLHTPLPVTKEKTPAESQKPVLTQDVTPQTSATTETVDNPPVEEELEWKTMECPSCHKVTRLDTGHCRHCNALLSPAQEKPESKLDQQSSTPQIPSPVETQKDLPIQMPPSKTQYPPPPPSPKIQEPVIVVKSKQEQKIEKVPPQPVTSKSSKQIFFLVIGGLAILLIILIINLQKLTSSTGDLSSKNMNVSAPLPSPTPVITDQDLILGVLNSVRDAMLSQNTTQYLSAFSPNFPDLDTKQKGLQDLWNTYHILDLKYDVSDEIPLEPKDNKAEILIHWSMSLRSIKDNKTISAPETNLVKFEKINGEWKISDVSVR